MAPPPGTWRSTPKAAEHAAKNNFNILPDDFEFTEEEKNLLKMYDAVKLFEREATRLKEKKARERIYANQPPSEGHHDGEEKEAADGDVELPPKPDAETAKKRKTGRGKKKKAEASMHDSDEDDDSDMDSVGHGSDVEDDAGPSLDDLRAAKLNKLREEVQAKKEAMEEEGKTEEHLRNELLATNEDNGIDDGRVLLKRKRPQAEDTGMSLLSNMMNAQTPPHDFSEKLGLKSWKGKELFPVTPDERTWTPPQAPSNPNDGAFVAAMENFDINLAQNGEGPNTLALKFTAPIDSRRFSFNIAGPRHDDFNSILFHFNPRQRQKGGQLVINDKQDGVWGRAVQLPLNQVPKMFDEQSVTLLIQINGDGFDVFIEGKHCARLEHRVELPSDKCTLFLQFPSCDDKCSPENWKVFKAWWGNKESLVKDDISYIAGVNTFDSVHPRKLFIQGLPKVKQERDVELRRAELERAFRRYGGARGVSTIVPKHASYAFVEFETEAQCDHALHEMADNYPYKLSRARRSKHEALQDERAAAAAGGKSKETGGWN